MAMTTGKETGMMFKVSVEGLPDMIMVGRSPGQIKSQLRKIVKQPSMINDVQRMPRSKVKKLYRDLGAGKDTEEVEESTINEIQKSWAVSKGPAIKTKRGTYTAFTSSHNPYHHDIRITHGPDGKKIKKADSPHQIMGVGNLSNVKKKFKELQKKHGVAENKETFKPHMMWDPKTGKGYMAKKYEDHLRMQKMGYTHDDPKTKKVEENYKKEILERAQYILTRRKERKLPEWGTPESTKKAKEMTPGEKN